MNVDKSEIELAWVPVLHIATKWEKISDGKFLLYNDVYQKKMIVSFSSILIISQIDGKKTIKEITDKLTDWKSTYIDYERVYCFVKYQLDKNGILKSDTVVMKNKNSHLHLEQIIIPGNILCKICKPFIFLFNKKIALCVFSTCMMSSIWAVISGKIWDHSVFYDANIFVFLIALIFLILFHELGHSVAIQVFGKEGKGIGFAFYFFSPVLFADVSPSWILSSKKRMVVDLGGFYFQFILTSIYLIFYQLTNCYSLLSVVYLSFFLFLFNMNPLINTDMYWFLSDALNRYNLNDDARKEFIFFIKKRSARNVNLFLLLFIIIKSVFVVFVFVVIFYYLINVIHLLCIDNYEITLKNVFRDAILVLGFLFFVKELFLTLIKRGKSQVV